MGHYSEDCLGDGLILNPEKTHLRGSITVWLVCTLTGLVSTKQ